MTEGIIIEIIGIAVIVGSAVFSVVTYIGKSTKKVEESNRPVLTQLTEISADIAILKNNYEHANIQGLTEKIDVLTINSAKIDASVEHLKTQYLRMENDVSGLASSRETFREYIHKVINKIDNRD